MKKNSRIKFIFRIFIMIMGLSIICISCSVNRFNNISSDIYKGKYDDASDSLYSLAKSDPSVKEDIQYSYYNVLIKGLNGDLEGVNNLADSIRVCEEDSLDKFNLDKHQKLFRRDIYLANNTLSIRSNITDKKILLLPTLYDKRTIDEKYIETISTGLYYKIKEFKEFRNYDINTVSTKYHKIFLKYRLYDCLCTADVIDRVIESMEDNDTDYIVPSFITETFLTNYDLEYLDNEKYQYYILPVIHSANLPTTMSTVSDVASIMAGAFTGISVLNLYHLAFEVYLFSSDFKYCYSHYYYIRDTFSGDLNGLMSKVSLEEHYWPLYIYPSDKY